jgi:putative phosphoribosyl transferase
MFKDTAERVQEQAMRFLTGGVTLVGDLCLPASANGVVIFAHGSGSSRFSPRNRSVAKVLNRANLATLLIDLLTSEEEAVDIQTAELRFDIPLLAERLQGAAEWVARHGETCHMLIGYFGASTGAAAALVAAAKYPKNIAAIVSRGGRPDLAGNALAHVHAPTLLIVGERDPQVIRANRMARADMQTSSELELIPGATHLFEEPGTLEQVAELACRWFLRYLPKEPRRAAGTRLAA